MTKPNTRIVQATVWAILARTSGSGDDARNGTGVDAVLGPGDRQGPRATPIFQVFQTQSEARSRISNTNSISDNRYSYNVRGRDCVDSLFYEPSFFLADVGNFPLGKQFRAIWRVTSVSVSVSVSSRS